MAGARRSYGTGSLIVRRTGTGDVWYGQWREDGQQVKRRIGPKRTHGRADGLTKADAEKTLRELIAADSGNGRRDSAQTLEDVWRRYDVDRGRRLKERTRAEYAGYMRVHVARFFSGKAIGKIGREDVSAFVSHLERRGLAAKTIRNLVMFVAGLFNYAVGNGWVGLNPAKGVDVPEPEDAGADELRFLEPHEVNDLVIGAPAGRYQLVDQAMYTVAAMAGLRTGELLALRWESVDFANGRIRVVRAFSGAKVSTTKGRRQRSVPMAPRVAQVLDELREASAWTGLDDLVFADPVSGGKLAGTPRYRRWQAAKLAAGVDAGFVFHDLRHTFGTTCARNGEPLATIAQWMGHQSTSTTEIYAMHAPAHDDGAKLGAYFAVADPRIGAPGTISPASERTESTSEHLKAA